MEKYIYTPLLSQSQCEVICVSRPSIIECFCLHFFLSSRYLSVSVTSQVSFSYISNRSSPTNKMFHPEKEADQTQAKLYIK